MPRTIPGQDRRVPGRTAGLGEDARDLELVEPDRLRREVSPATRITGSSPKRTLGRQIGDGEVADDSTDDVTDVGHPFADVVVVNLGELDLVLVEGIEEGRLGVELLAEDGGLDPADEGGIADHEPMGPGRCRPGPR